MKESLTRGLLKDQLQDITHHTSNCGVPLIETRMNSLKRRAFCFDRRLFNGPVET